MQEYKKDEDEAVEIKVCLVKDHTKDVVGKVVEEADDVDVVEEEFFTIKRACVEEGEKGEKVKKSEKMKKNVEKIRKNSLFCSKIEWEEIGWEDMVPSGTRSKKLCPSGHAANKQSHWLSPLETFVLGRGGHTLIIISFNHENAETDKNLYYLSICY